MFSQIKLKTEESVSKHVPISKGKRGGKRIPNLMKEDVTTTQNDKEKAEEESRNELKKPLVILFRKCIEEGAIPSEWKEAHVTPIYKKGKKDKSNNYRPVNLTSIVCKGLEKTFLNTIDIWTKLLDDGIPIDASHVDQAASKANSILVLARRSFEYMDKNMFISVFVCLARPHLEYANAVWAPFFKKDIRTIEKVQRKGTRMIPELRNLDYERRLKRFHGDMIPTYKYLHGFYDVDPVMMLEVYEKTRGHGLKLHKNIFNKMVRQRFFSTRVLNSWNSLPKAIAEAAS
eukprot:gene2583-2984_t